MNRFISGIFPDRDSAERAVDELRDLGYDRSEINVMLDRSTHDRDFGDGAATTQSDTQVAANVGIGASFGGTLGAIIAGVTATGAIVATGGVATPIVAGPIAAILAGAGAGGVAGGIIGALTSAGVPETRAHDYRERLDRGGILVGVYARPEDEAAVARILDDGTFFSRTSPEYAQAQRPGNRV
jgi:hypothetical protein